MNTSTVWDQIIPRPAEVSAGPGVFIVGSRIWVEDKGPKGATGEDLDAVLTRVNVAVNRLTHRGTEFFELVPDGQAADLVISGADGGATSDRGTYRLEVTANSIAAVASDEEGIAAALATLTYAILLAEESEPTHSVPPTIGSSSDAAERSVPPPGAPHCEVPSVTIADQPAEEWRGFMFDVVRHFFPLESLQQMLDILWLLRLNRFHLHLTDDQGWRLPVPEYPRLTAIGAWRSDETSEDGQYGGSYSAEDLQGLDRDARLLGITIVPEIDLPGHASAAVTAYPDVSCDGVVPGVETRWGIFPAVICATSEAARTLVTAAYRAASAIFAGPYIHIGGDEVLPDKWSQCPKCSTRDDAYQEVVRFMAETVLGLGRRPIAWDEAAGLDLPRETIIVNWRDAYGAKVALERGYDLILAPQGRAAYFDHKHLDDALEPGRLSFGTVADTAAFAPHSYVGAQAISATTAGSASADEKVKRTAGLAAHPGRRSDASPTGRSLEGTILGGQANLWSEEILYHRHFEYMAIVRLAAIAEGLWSGSPADRRPEFFSILDRLRRRLSDQGLAVYRGPYTNGADRATLSS